MKRDGDLHRSIVWILFDCNGKINFHISYVLFVLHFCGHHQIWVFSLSTGVAACSSFSFFRARGLLCHRIFRFPGFAAPVLGPRRTVPLKLVASFPIFLFALSFGLGPWSLLGVFARLAHRADLSYGLDLIPRVRPSFSCCSSIPALPVVLLLL
jgi:hypothetical protein